MPDTEISKLPPLVASQIQDDDVLAIADLSATETKKVKAGDLIIGVLGNLPDDSIDPNKLNWANLDSGSISGDDIVNASIADEKLFGNTLTSRVIAPNAIGSSELADSSVDTAALQVGAVDNGALATNSVNDRVIQSGGVSNDNLSAGSVTVNKLSLNNGELSGSFVTDGTITQDKLAANLPGDILGIGAIGSDQVANGSITASKLGTDAVTTDIVSDLSITDAKIATVDGTKIVNGTIAAPKFNAGTFGRGISNNGTDVGITNSVTAATASGISWNEQGLVTSSVPLQGIDLPVSTNSTVGGVSVPTDSGLNVSGIGEISIANSILAGTTSGITFDQNGLITSTAALIDTDLPTASTTQIGGVSVPTSGNNPLTISAAGELRLGLSSSTAANGLVSVDVDEFGLVTNGSTVLATDQVPALDASKITTGTFPVERLTDDSISAQKMGDYTTCLMQEGFPGSSPDYFLGMLWWQPSTAQLRVYSRGSAGNNWSPVGFGALQANNLRWGGVFDASTGTVSIVTDFGTTAGLTAGNAIPAPSNELSGLYLICQTEGSNVNQPNVSTDTFTPGDWLLCINEVEGYIHIDSGASSGGGGSSYLSSLLDVNISSLKEGERLQADVSGMWFNTDVMDGGSF